METIVEIMQKHGMAVPDNKVYISIPNAKEKILSIASNFCKDFKWLPEYDEIVNWIENNDGKGLFMYGNCGRGKTIFAKYIIPAIVLQNLNKIIMYYDIQDFKISFNEMCSKKLISIDDIGTEEVINNFGNKIEPFSELIDISEKKGKLIIVSCNLNFDTLNSRYGERTVDRIYSTTKRVLFKGESLRRK